MDRGEVETTYSTSVTVAVRLRPFHKRELDDDRLVSLYRHSPNTIFRNNNNNNVNGKKCVEMTNNVVTFNSSMEFIFDHCIKPHHDNKHLYLKVGQPLLDHALDGFSVCMFAFGQTGSGKTHSIMGPEEDPGLARLFVRNLFDKISHFPETTQVKVECSYYEIYNEKIHDLLGNDTKAVLRVREHPTSGPYIVDLSSIECTSYFEVLDWLKLGQKRRFTAATSMNNKSSRSHTIFTLVITQDRKIDNEFKQSITSKVNIVDLAGSERTHMVNATGVRLKESVLINKSLLTLGKVITQLAEYDYVRGSSNTFIPYRESTLTWLLKESLGGNSKTTMIATISPSIIHQEETLSTLRYAATARRVVNIVRVNEDPKVRKIRELENEIEVLKQRIVILESNKANNTTNASHHNTPVNHRRDLKQSTGNSCTNSPIKVYQSIDLLNYIEELFADILQEANNKKKIQLDETQSFAVETKSLAAETKSPAAENKSPVAEIKSPAVETKRPTVETKRSAVETKRHAIKI